MNTKIPNIFFKEEELEDLYQNNSEKIRVPTNQTQYSFETKENLQKFIDNQFPTKLEKSKYKEYRNEWHRRAKNFDPGPAPLAVCIELVSTCNLSCPMCYTITKNFQDSVTGAQRMLPWKIVTSIIDECSELGVYSILFSWRGESTLYRSIDENGEKKDFADALKYAREKGILEITSLTHGQQINEKMALKIIDADPSWISFSFDGINDVYNSIRTPTKFKNKSYDAFKVVTNNLKNLVDLRNKAGKTRPQIRSNTIYPAIANDPMSYYNYLKKIGVDMITVNELLDLRDGLPDEIAINKNWACQYPFQRLTVSANGTILPCTGAHNEELGLVLGYYNGTKKNKLNDNNVNQNTDLKYLNLKAAWKSEKLENIRNLHKTGNRCEINPGCKNCSHGYKKHGFNREHSSWDYKKQKWSNSHRVG